MNFHIHFLTNCSTTKRDKDPSAIRSLCWWQTVPQEIMTRFSKRTIGLKSWCVSSPTSSAVKSSIRLPPKRLPATIKVWKSFDYPFWTEIFDGLAYYIQNLIPNWIGYFVRVTSLAEVREQVLKYIPVLSRPMVMYQQEHPIMWTPVYVDVAVSFHSHIIQFYAISQILILSHC